MANSDTHCWAADIRANANFCNYRWILKLINLKM